MRTAEELAREVGFGYSDVDGLARLIALVRAEALEEAAKVCDVTPPYPFWGSPDAADAIRALKAAQEPTP